MTTDQRKKARQRAAVCAAIDGFLDRPCRPPPQQTRALLNHLCVKLGYCLAPDDYESIVADPPTDPLAFAKLVAEREGSGIAPEELEAILELVLATFEGVAQRADQEST